MPCVLTRAPAFAPEPNSVNAGAVVRRLSVLATISIAAERDPLSETSSWRSSLVHAAIISAQEAAGGQLAN
jgi:hypothetical protein